MALSKDKNLPLKGYNTISKYIDQETETEKNVAT